MDSLIHFLASRLLSSSYVTHILISPLVAIVRVGLTMTLESPSESSSTSTTHREEKAAAGTSNLEEPVSAERFEQLRLERDDVIGTSPTFEYCDAKLLAWQGEQGLDLDALTPQELNSYFERQDAFIDELTRPNQEKHDKWYGELSGAERDAVESIIENELREARLARGDSDSDDDFDCCCGAPVHVDH
ncbi:hypothetical protein FB45DRAFT_351323 [Roridomyces roridus]|uniref:Uncharacterized protein n=1 Tax=Roridomyces roridus TaxID=1738132 RepID=A0AAD7FW66_9AGAR|nr:hypothetical protein FB45DRAFT_351323 [Roridomyces roridus]